MNTLFTQASFDGTEFTIDRTINLDGLTSPSYAVSESVLAGVRGEKFNQALMRKRQVTLEFWVCHSGEADYFQKRREILDACNKDKGEGTLLLTIHGRQYRLNAVPEPPEIGWPKLQDFAVQLQFVCYDPVIYAAQSQSSLAIFAPGGGGYTFPYVFPYEFVGSGQTGLFSIEYEGHVSAEPKLTLVGPLTDPTVTNTTTGEFFSLDYEIVSGETVIVENRRVLSGVRNLAEFIDDGSTWLPLVQGANQMRLTTADSSDTGTVTASWTEAYGGI